MKPWISFIKANLLLILGRLRFNQAGVGDVVDVNGQKFIVFRQMERKSWRAEPNPEVLFKVRFHLARMNPGINRIFSIFTIPFFCGLQGFRSKLWLMDESSGDFMGIYEWSSRKDAENYAQSFAMRFMAGRSVPGTVSFEIKPNSDRRTQ